jgi:hypothetical protein
MRGPIQSALDTHLAELIIDPVVAWEGVPFEPARGVCWYEPRLLGGAERILSVGTPTPHLEQRGVYQVKLSAPADAIIAGAGQINVKLDALLGHFRAGLVLNKNGCTLHLLGNTIAAPVVDPRWYAVPVSIQYMAHYQA